MFKIIIFEGILLFGFKPAVTILKVSFKNFERKRVFKIALSNLILLEITKAVSTVSFKSFNLCYCSWSIEYTS